MAAEVNCNDICQTGDSEQACLVCSMAKTAHGKAWEGPVCKMFIDDIGYRDDKASLFSDWELNSNLDPTAPHDISEKLMGVNWDGVCLDGTPIREKYGDGISVKLIKKGCDVCMGKIERIWHHFEEGPWSMIVGFYEMKKKKIKGENVMCLCIDKIYNVPFLRGLVDRELVFGNIENWTEKMNLLEKKVFEAKSYKNGDKGLSGLINPDIPLTHFNDLTGLYQDRRLSGPTTPESSDAEILQAASDCYNEINEIKTSLMGDNPETLIVKPAIKMDKSQVRTQGRISYKLFLELVETIGRDITDEEIVMENGLLHPIKKMTIQNSGETKQGGGFVVKKSKIKKSKRKTHKKKKKNKKSNTKKTR